MDSSNISQVNLEILCKTMLSMINNDIPDETVGKIVKLFICPPKKPVPIIDLTAPDNQKFVIPTIATNKIGFRPYSPPTWKTEIVEVKSEDKTEEAKEEVIKFNELEWSGIMDQITKTIISHQNPNKIVNDTPKRGRPENIKSWDPCVLTALLQKWEDDLVKKMRKDQRIDALFASVSRFFKKIPDVFLKYIGSRCQFKSRDIWSVLRSYLKSFLKGYLVIFSCEEGTNLSELFLDYVCLCFPTTKVTEILNKWLAEGSIKDELYNDKINQLVLRKKASKKAFKDFYKANVCLRTICQVIPTRFINLDGILLDKVNSSLEYLEKDDDEIQHAY